jgi:hypothetical protein
LLQVDHDQERSPFVIETFEDPVEELIGLAVERAFEWTFMDRCGQSFTELAGNGRLAHRETASPPAMPRRHAQDDAEDPGAQAGATFELGQSAVTDEKDILRCIF